MAILDPNRVSVGVARNESFFGAARLTDKEIVMPHAANDREFRVHARHIDAHHAHNISESSFEAAAVAYMEDYPHEIGDGDEISVIVQEVGSGHQHCFRIDIDTGATHPCG